MRFKKQPALLLVIAMCLSLMPTYAFADDNTARFNGTEYSTLADAVTAAKAAGGGTVELIADDYSLADGSEIEINTSLTITGAVDGDGKPLYTIHDK